MTRPPRPRQPGNLTLLGVICLFFLAPLWWLAAASTKSYGELVGDVGLLTISDSFVRNVVDVFSRDGSPFGRWLLNSALYAGVGAVAGTMLATGVGYALSKYDFPGRRTLFSIILAGVLVPPSALAIPLFLMFSGVGLTNTMWAVLLPSVVSPLGVYLARVVADAAVPDELVEAAIVDGASGTRIFRSVALPLMRPGLVAIFLFIFVGIWNNFLLPLVMLSSEELYPVTLGLYSWSGQYILDPTLATSVLVGSLIAVVPVIVVFIALQRYWSVGLRDGALKS